MDANQPALSVSSSNSTRPLIVGIGVGANGWQLAAQVAEELAADAWDGGSSAITPAIALVLATSRENTNVHGADSNSATALAHQPRLPHRAPPAWRELSGGEEVLVEAGQVYLPANGFALELRDGKLVSVDLPADEHAAPIDHLFTSLASSHKEHAIAVILSGTGSDGTLGLRAISDAGGMSIAQSIDTAVERSMPRSAAALGSVDHVLPPEAIAGEIRNHAQHMQEQYETDDADDLNRQVILAIPQIAAALEKHTKNDFKHYKTTTLVRRIRRRMHVLKIEQVDAYVELLNSSREETVRLFRDLLISVTAFFRDAHAFDSLAREVLMPLVEQHRGDAALRIWVPGCATGQEPYSIAMLLAEILDQTQRDINVQIFATDLDEHALSVARTGSYPIGIQDEIPPPRLRQFFVKRGSRYFASKRIRSMVIFSSHNLISDPPFTKVDLVSCRNLLIYLGSHLQKKLIPLFHYAIKPGGFLFLGPAETLSVNKELFRAVHIKHRLYQRRVTTLDRSTGWDIPMVNLGRFGVTDEGDPSAEFDLFRYAQQIILGEFSPQWAVVDDDGQIQTLSSDPAPFLKMSGGKFKNNIVAMAHESLRIGLRAAFAEAKKHRRRALAEDMSLHVEGGLQKVHITVQPMPEMGEDASLHLVVFHRIGTPLQVDSAEDEPTRVPGSRVVQTSAAHVIEQLESELARTREALERTVQELETSNEELKSSNEELLSMNEEMQSANEELETSQEELQASNEMLVRSNNDIQYLQRSTHIATIFLDNELRIRSFTPAVTAIYDLIDSDIGRPLAKFVSEIHPMPALPQPDELADDAVIEDTLTSTSGKVYIRSVIPYHTPSGDHEGIVVNFVDVTALADAKSRLELALRAGGMAAWEWTPDASFWTAEVFELLGIDSSLKPAPSLFFSHVHPDDKDQLQATWQNAITGTTEYDCEFRIVRPDGEIRWLQGVGQVIRDGEGEVLRMYGLNWDSTQEKLQAIELRESERHATEASKSKSEFLANMSHEIRTPMTAILGYADLLQEFVEHDEAKLYLQTIRRNGAYLLDIVNDILDLSKIEAGKLDVESERFDPCHVIEDVRGIMEVRAVEQGLTLSVDYDGKLPTSIISDAIRLKQILINLVGNAVKFTSEGRVNIRVRLDADQPILHIEVADTGIGMTVHQQRSLFQAFSQGDATVSRTFGGTGLGLAISQRLAAMLGGEIQVSSTVGVGSTFFVRIATGDLVGVERTEYPRTLPTHPPEDTADDSEPTRLNGLILVVDDRRDIRFLSKRLLTAAGAVVDECEDGQIAVNYFLKCRKTGKCPDLILLDMQMPNLDGYETARQIRKLGYAGPIIALTADAMQGDMNECLEAGCNDYLSKPIDAKKLLKMVQRFQ
ncbi:CheR family methyltransferase [Allorhodopirellula heiligendammensis]|uniref:Autoinducer 2 sensor kinase/phosphatase LuxQ n=1 Tax=Allorhodopirellula heiligendammensis TaxID=2714739 RepID=A0A5C6BHA2_9BACT|nr:CheR family methyltransferase [Allorhodopirellula heiligendammensis]TWU10891.1 Autoinducer 2 sensor kinase/phosphatase LuxQ [Allorhodopirellula heiligendammensis]